MNGIDSLNAAFSFTQAQTVSQKTKEKENLKTEKSKKSAFTSLLEKTQEAENLVSQGLPSELAGLSVEESVIYLKDAVDMAADALSEEMNAANFAKFRKSVSQFLKFVQKNSFEVAKIKRLRREVRVKGLSPFVEEKRERDPYFQIRVVDQKLEELAAMVLQNHQDKLQMMSKVDEIKGLLVDFFSD